MTRHIVARTTDIPPGGNKVVGVEGRDIVVFHVNGEFFALLNPCRPIRRRVSMTHAIRFHRTGGPEVLVWEEVAVGKPGPNEARIRHTAVGLNFIDIYNRSGLYPVPLPSGLGGEGAGVVEEVGSGVTDLKPGDRVAYGNSPVGAYSEARLIPADRLLK